MREKYILKDSFNRVVKYLRLSITDRCNFRCFYCKPIKDFKYIPHSEMLSFEDLYFLLGVLKKYGVSKLRITGGEPFVKHGFIDFLREVSRIIPSVHLTTNGFFIKKEIDSLIKNGVKSINVSLDTLSRENFISITKVDALEQVIEGIKALSETNIKTKINTVIMKKNEGEVFDLIDFASNLNLPIRFIELMPISTEVRKQFVSEERIRKIISERYNFIPIEDKIGIGPSVYYRIISKNNSAIIGFISALTHNFCATCDKIRITSDGKLRVCLASDEEVSLKQKIRDRDEKGLITLIEKALLNKPEKHNMNIDDRKISKAMFQIGG